MPKFIESLRISIGKTSVIMRRFGSHVCPPSWRVACVKTWLGGWVTDTRLQNADRGCVLGCRHRGSLKHYFQCPLFRGLVERMACSPLPSAPLEALGLASPSPESLRSIALMCQLHRLLHAKRGDGDAQRMTFSFAAKLSTAKAARLAVDLPTRGQIPKTPQAQSR